MSDKLDLTELKMINFSLWKNESELDDMGNMDSPKTIEIINCILNAPLIFMSIIGNALVLTAILRTFSLRSAPSILFLCSLAVSDLLVGLVAQPVYISNALIYSDSSPALKQATEVMFFLACGVSLSTMTAISVDRFLALRYHMRYSGLVTVKRALFTIAGIWLVLVVLSCLRIIWKRSLLFLAIVVGGIAICFFISTFSYIRIYQIVQHHKLAIPSQQQAVQRLSNDATNVKQSTKSAINTLITLIYFICMIFCYLPILVVTIILAFEHSLDSRLHIADTTAFLNSSINPFLYCWRAQEIRAAVWKTIRQFFCKRARQTYSLSPLAEKNSNFRFVKYCKNGVMQT